MDENETTEEYRFSAADFATEIGKSYVISSAVSAGTITGLVLVAVAFGKLKDYRDARKAKKENTENIENKD